MWRGWRGRLAWVGRRPERERQWCHDAASGDFACEASVVRDHAGAAGRWRAADAGVGPMDLHGPPRAAEISGIAAECEAAGGGVGGAGVQLAQLLRGG